jgi:hypothetical protein
MARMLLTTGLVFALSLLTAIESTNLHLPSLGLADVWLVQPGSLPPYIGIFEFKSTNNVTYFLGDIIPLKATHFSFTVVIGAGWQTPQTWVNVWMWTECNGQRFTRFKQFYVYQGVAYTTNSETFDLPICSTKAALYVMSDQVLVGATLLLYAVGYSFF